MRPAWCCVAASARKWSCVSCAAPTAASLWTLAARNTYGCEHFRTPHGGFVSDEDERNSTGPAEDPPDAAPAAVVDSTVVPVAAAEVAQPIQRFRSMPMPSM